MKYSNMLLCVGAQESACITGRCFSRSLGNSVSYHRTYWRTIKSAVAVNEMLSVALSHPRRVMSFGLGDIPRNCIGPSWNELYVFNKNRPSCVTLNVATGAAPSGWSIIGIASLICARKDARVLTFSPARHVYWRIAWPKNSFS